MIIIEPRGGLANRMRALDSSLNLATKVGHSTFLLWGLDASLNCRYNLLFEKPANTRVLNFKNSHAARLFRRLLLPLSKLCFQNLSQNKIQQFVGKMQSLEDLAPQHNLYIQTCGRFYPSEKPFVNLRISKAIISHANTMTDRFSPRTVGVHIRRSDNVLSIRHSTTNGFVSLMKKELEAFPETVFFVATDSPHEEDVMKKTYSGRIITLPKFPPDRNRPKSIEDALIDLLCLSRCNKILGSYWSSFSETAAQMGGIELVVVDQ